MKKIPKLVNLKLIIIVLLLIVVCYLIQIERSVRYISARAFLIQMSNIENLDKVEPLTFPEDVKSYLKEMTNIKK